MNIWRQYPSLRVLLPFVFGILFSAYFKINSIIPLYLSLFFLTLFSANFFYYKFKHRHIFALLLSLTVFFLGIQLTTVKTEIFKESHFSKHLEGADYLQVRVSERLIEKENSFKTVLEVEKIISKKKAKVVSGKLLAYFRKGDKLNVLNYGDIILIKNKINKVGGAKNPYQFDYKMYLELHQINHQLFLDSNSWIKTSKNTANPLIVYSQKMRDKLFQILKENGVVGNQLKVGSALLLGYREQLDKDLVRSYSSAGAMHVLAVSGLHVGILFLMLQHVLKFLTRFKNGNYYFTIIIILALWFYALMTGLSASVMRASAMFSLILIGNKIINNKPSIYNTLGISAILLLVFNPYLIYQVGFQLSYLAVVGIVYLQPKFVKLIYVPNKFLNQIWSITCVSFAAQIATFPLGLYYFHQFPVYFFISNLIVIPIAVIIFYLGISLFVSSIFGGISLVIGKVINWFLWVLNQSIYFTESIKFSLVEEISISKIEIYLLYLTIITFVYSFYNKKIRTVYVGLFLFVGFLSLQLIDNYKSINQKRITFYSVNNETLFEFVSGKTVYFVSRQEYKNDWSKMLFNVNHNWHEQNITKKVYFNIDSLHQKRNEENLYLNNSLFQFYNYKVLLINEMSIEIYGSIKLDYVLVSKDNLKYLKRFLKNNTPKTIILDSTISLYKTKYWKKIIESKGVEFVTLAEKYFSVEKF